MKFQLNGETCETDATVSVQVLLEQHELAQRRVAVAINARVVPRSSFADVKIRDGDRVEVIQAVGGG